MFYGLCSEITLPDIVECDPSSFNALNSIFLNDGIVRLYTL